MLRIASIDIGKKNFSQYVEDSYISELEKLHQQYNNLPRKFQRRTAGQMNPYIKVILNQICIQGDRVQTGVYDLRDNKDCDNYDLETRKNVLQHLNSFIELWETCDIFVIEQQYFNAFAGGRKRKKAGTANMDAIKIGEGVFMWFLEKFPDKEVTYFGSQFKTQILGSPYKMSKTERKKWAEKKAEEIYRNRGDQEMINIFDLCVKVKSKRINTEEKVRSYMNEFEKSNKHISYLAEKIIRERQKMDDVADTLVQCQAYKYKYLVACF